MCDHGAEISHPEQKRGFARTNAAARVHLLIGLYLLGKNFVSPGLFFLVQPRISKGLVEIGAA
jgi:hypothetical protein